MKQKDIDIHMEAFRTEAMMLLRFQLAYNRIIKFPDIQSIGRSEFCDKIIALKAIENDLVIRICKFGDTTKKTHSFNKIKITENHTNKNCISIKIEEFNTLIKEIREVRRHKELAHLEFGKEDNQYEPTYNLTPAIKLIIDIVDLINIDIINYTWKDGRYEVYDLRKEVLGQS